jgi:hypothetical protein
VSQLSRQADERRGGRFGGSRPARNPDPTVCDGRGEAAWGRAGGPKSPCLFPCGIVDGQCGAVTVIQRANSDLRLYPHFHVIQLDGLYTPGHDGETIFHPAPGLTQQDVDVVVERASKRILRFLLRGVVITLVTAPSDAGVTVVCDETIGDKDPLQARLLGKYILRPPLANVRLRILDDGDVRLLFKRPWSDGASVDERLPGPADVVRKGSQTLRNPVRCGDAPFRHAGRNTLRNRSRCRAGRPTTLESRTAWYANWRPRLAEVSTPCGRG